MKHSYTLLVSWGAWMTIMGFSLVQSDEYWGFFGHRRINRLAVFTLVPEMMPVFKKHIEFLTEHAVDPDKRRYAVPGEAVRHYIDLDVWRQMSSNSIPGTYAAARACLGDWVIKPPGGQAESIFAPVRFEKNGKKTYIRFNHTDTPGIDLYEYQVMLSSFFKTVKDPEDEVWWNSDSINAYFTRPVLPPGKILFWVDSFSRHGILPFYIPQVYQKLVSAFAGKNLPAILRLAADLGHYIGDAHVPLHTTSNYNGQLTGQTGLHAFWESRIPELFADQSYDYLVGRADYIKDIEAFSWTMINDSHRYVDSVLRIEKRLSIQFPADQQYCFTERNQVVVKLPCEAYARTYEQEMKGMVEQRMRKAILAVGSVWYSAWIDAGQPDLATLPDSNVPASDSLEEKSSRLKTGQLRPEH